MSWRDGLTWNRPAYFVGVLRQMIADRPAPDLAKVRARIATQEVLRARLAASLGHRT